MGTHFGLGVVILAVLATALTEPGTGRLTRDCGETCKSRDVVV